MLKMIDRGSLLTCMYYIINYVLLALDVTTKCWLRQVTPTIGISLSLDNSFLLCLIKS